VTAYGMRTPSAVRPDADGAATVNSLAGEINARQARMHQIDGRLVA
jgi:hypothetical protein